MLKILQSQLDGLDEEVEEVVIPVVDEVPPAQIGGGEAEEGGKKNNVGEDDEHQGEEGLVFLEVRLITGDHPAGEEEVEGPSGSDDKEENLSLIHI